MSVSHDLRIAEAVLSIVTGPCRGQSVTLKQHRVMIGRELDCDINLADPACSRHHAALLCDEHTIRIRDLGSTNGTRVNGELIQTTTILNDGDQIQIGGNTMVIRHANSSSLSGETKTFIRADAPTVSTKVDQPKILF